MGRHAAAGHLRPGVRSLRGSGAALVAVALVAAVSLPADDADASNIVGTTILPAGVSVIEAGGDGTLATPYLTTISVDCDALPSITSAAVPFLESEEGEYHRITVAITAPPTGSDECFIVPERNLNSGMIAPVFPEGPAVVVGTTSSQTFEARLTADVRDFDFTLVRNTIGLTPPLAFHPLLLVRRASDTASGDQNRGAVTPATPVLTGGSSPTLNPGAGAWQLPDGTSVPLAVVSTGTSRIRYSADGIQVTFTGGAGTSANNGLVVEPTGEIMCEVCLDLETGDVIEVWMFSSPRLVAAHLVGIEPCQTFTVPVVAPLDGGGPISAGAHTLQLALPTASGMQAVNVGVTVGGPVPGSIPAGEGPAVPRGLIALGLLAAAGAAVAVRRLAETG